MLGVPPKLTSDTVNKGLKTFKVLSEEGFEIRLRDLSCALMVVPMLSLFEANKATEK